MTNFSDSPQRTGAVASRHPEPRRRRPEMDRTSQLMRVRDIVERRHRSTSRHPDDATRHDAGTRIDGRHNRRVARHLLSAKTRQAES